MWASCGAVYRTLSVLGLMPFGAIPHSGSGDLALISGPSNKHRGRPNRPSVAIQQHKRPGYVGADLGGEEDHRSRKLVGPGSASQDTLAGVGRVPFGMVFDLGGKRCLHYPGGYDVRPHTPVPSSTTSARNICTVPALVVA